MFFNYRLGVVQQSSRIYPPCITETLYLLNSNSPFPLPPAPGNRHMTLCFSEVDCFYPLREESCCTNVKPSESIHVVICGRIAFSKAE